MNHLIPIGEAARYLGISVGTLRRWDRCGYFTSDSRTMGKHRRYKLSKLQAYLNEATELPDHKMVVGYARVSSSDQKDDLTRQKEVLNAACAEYSNEYEVICDLGSGINYRKQGLLRLIRLILSGCVGTLLLTHEDRLLRFGYDLLLKICEFHGVNVVVLNECHEQNFEERLAKDLITIITVFSSRLYGRRSQENRRRRNAA